MVDAALGGKTGADLPQGKNLVGAFHSPRTVLIDPNALSSLPEAELVNGLAETIKHGVISDPRLFEMCAGGLAPLRHSWDAVLPRAVAVKARIVTEDPTEQGRRAALNLGHSIGHAVETASEYTLRHGEAVAVGMVLETRLAEEIGLAQPGLAGKIAEALRQAGLPTQIPEGISLEAVRRGMLVDKKRRDGQVRFALPAAIGDVRVGVAVPREIVEAVLNGM
jgi:3-dehydroquinate synthetase